MRPHHLQRADVARDIRQTTIRILASATPRATPEPAREQDNQVPSQ